jgi:hypothetical protein
MQWFIKPSLGHARRAERRACPPKAPTNSRHYPIVGAQKDE